MNLKLGNFFSYWMSKDIRKAMTFGTHVTPYELFILSSLAKSSCVAIEIGSYMGASSYVIGNALIAGSKENKDPVLICVDTWENHAMSEGKKDTFDCFLENINDLENVILPVRGFSEKVVDKVAGSCSEKVDFLFIDANHDYAGVKADWENYKGFLKSGAIVAFHDYGWADGVQRVVEEDVKPLLQTQRNVGNLFWGELK